MSGDIGGGDGGPESSAWTPRVGGGARSPRAAVKLDNSSENNRSTIDGDGTY